ncbi:50S ribosomal subunit L30 [Amylostereum chailletii]|nr:50S ribosomal subunit L30 [Amylostereum chailletii]
MSSSVRLASCSRLSRPGAFRTFATEATVPSASASPPTPTTRPKKPSRPILKTSVILNRSPILTRTPTLFERAYYNYQARIQRALHNPFPHEFYFKPGSLLESKFNYEERRRERQMFGPGFGADSKFAPGADVTAEDLKKFGQDEDQTTALRKHASDISKDVKSLDRKGQRNLYLLMQKKEADKAVWRFPVGEVAEQEFLHEAAARNLAAQCGKAMDSWIVSRNPIGLNETFPPTPPTDSSAPPKTCVFFYKAHIMAGQVQPDGKSTTDFAWLTKQEIEERVDAAYWTGVKDMLSDF